MVVRGERLGQLVAALTLGGVRRAHQAAPHRSFTVR
jgi:hypothetical protein